MNGIDGNPHVAVSKFRTEGVHEWQGREGETDATQTAAALDANTEATLALAYEQRTANLIAFYSAGPIPGDRPGTWSALRADIADRIGIHRVQEEAGPW